MVIFTIFACVGKFEFVIVTTGNWVGSVCKYKDMGIYYITLLCEQSKGLNLIATSMNIKKKQLNT